MSWTKKSSSSLMARSNSGPNNDSLCHENFRWQQLYHYHKDHHQQIHNYHLSKVNQLFVFIISSLTILSISLCGHLISSVTALSSTAASSNSLLLNDAVSSSSSSSQVAGNGVFRIPDQQAFIGKLYYYQIDIPDNVRNFTLIQAGYTADQDQAKLPEWLYFDSKTGLLFGAPQEKCIYFIQMEAIMNDKKYEDIFVIETIDRLAYLSSSFISNNKWQQSDSSSTRQSHECRIELKKNFMNVKQIYDTIMIDVYRSYFMNSDQTFQNEQTMKQWLNQFNVQTVFADSSADGQSPTTLNKEYHLYYDVKECETLPQSSGSDHGSEQKNNLQLDQNSQLLLKQLNKLNVDSELIKITHRLYGGMNSDPDSDLQFNNFLNIDPSMTFRPSGSSSSSSFDHVDPLHHHHNHHHGHHHHHHHHHHKRNHRRRNAYADDDNIYETPALNKEMWSSMATTSTIDYSMNHLDNNQDNHLAALSRTAIPSMISPTFTGQQYQTPIQPTPSYPSLPSDITARVGHNNQYQPHHPHLPSYPQLYGTPVLVPELSINTKSIGIMDRNNFDQQLFTPVFTTATPTLHQPSTSTMATVMIDASKSLTIDSSESKPSISISDNDLIAGGSKILPIDDIGLFGNTSTSTTTSSTPEPTTTILNHRPFVNKRISKLSITAGKFWQFTIPEDTFYDKEDGNTRQLRIGFFKDSEILPADYWIQFDNENQYLYALPTDDDIGRHRFNLVAVDLQGGEATETIEIYVRQSRHSLSYTHKFILANITWDNDRYPERIQAVSSILQRMAIQVFEEMPSGGLNEAAQRQATLKHINVLNINKNPLSHQWSIIWTNDSLRRHPCPANEINFLFSRLYDITYPENDVGFMYPSPELRSALTPDFTIERVKRLFIGRSACGSFAATVDVSSSRHKEKLVFSNRLNRIGPYRLGSAFKFQIPKDTVYSMTRQVDTRQLALSLAPLEPEVDLPEFIYFDTHEQTIYGLPFKHEHIRTYELKLIAEDTVHGGSEHDIFILDVEHDINTREDYLMEITMSFLYRNIELTSRSQQRLTSKDFYQVAHSISTKLMGNSNLEAFRMLDISRHRFTKIAEHVMPFENNLLQNYEVNSNSLQTNNNEVDELEPSSKQQNKRHISYHYAPTHYHHLQPNQLIRPVRAINNLQSDYFYEFIWTNRTLVTSYQHSQNAMGGGSLFETKTCPKEVIQRDIYKKLFPRSVNEFLSNVNLDRNITITKNMDVMDVYNQVFDPLEANLEFLSVEWNPKSVCYNNPGLDSRILGAKPIKDTSAEEDDAEETTSLENSVASPETEDPSINIPVDAEPPELDEHPMMYYGDRLLAMLIPPIVILIALLFAVTIGCCFHRANQRRKTIGAVPPYHDESPTLYGQRIPIQLEFERGGLRGSGIHPSEQESMLDSKYDRHPIQIMPPKLRGPSTNLPAAAATAAAAAASHHHHGHHGPSHRNLPYQMLPQQ